MRRLKSETTAPPDFYRYTVPETGYRIEAVDSWTWEQKTREHLTANGIPIPDNLREIMHDQICSTLPPEYCLYHDGKWIDLRITWSDVIAGTVAIMKSLTGGFVPQEEADRRARICASCPMNVHVGGCSACKAVKYVVGDIAKKTTQYDSKLRNCAICKCHIPSLVHVRMEVLATSDNAEKQEQFPPHCWKKIGGENYIA